MAHAPAAPGHPKCNPTTPCSDTRRAGCCLAAVRRAAPFWASGCNTLIIANNSKFCCLADHDGANMTPSISSLNGSQQAQRREHDSSAVLVARLRRPPSPSRHQRPQRLEAVFHVDAPPSAKGIASFVEKGGYSHVFAPVSNNTKDFVPRIAAAFGVSPVTDICEVLNEDTFVRPFMRATR